MKGAAAFGAIAALIVLAVVALASMFTVDQTEQALVLRFGEPVAGRGLITTPGLHFKYPFVENVVFLDNAYAALVQQRNGGTEVGRGQKAIGHRRDPAFGLLGNVFNELRSNVRDFSELALINNTNYFAANIEARAGFTLPKRPDAESRR